MTHFTYHVYDLIFLSGGGGVDGGLTPLLAYRRWLFMHLQTVCVGEGKLPQPKVQGAPEPTATNRSDNTQNEQTALKTKQTSAVCPCEMTAAAAHLG